ncbi:MAG: T9SS type A sorting domain-containing protein [Syntrophothermus sp.]
MKKIYGLKIFFSILLLTRSLLAQWVQTDGPYGGNINVIAAYGNSLYAATSGDFYLSTNNGSSWNNISAGIPPANNIYKVEFFPNGKGGVNTFIASWKGIFMSTDNGKSWSKADSGMPENTAAFDLAVAGNNSAQKYIFASTVTFDQYNEVGIYRSADSGKSWSASDSGLSKENEYRSFAVTPGDSGGSYIFTSCMAHRIGSKLYRSTNFGVNWLEIDFPSTSIISTLFAVPGPSGVTYLIAGTEHDGIYRSNDNGKSWVHIITGLTHMRVTAFAADTANKIIYTCTGDGGVFRSANYGDIWTNVNSGLKDEIVNCLAVRQKTNGGTDLLAGTYKGGVFLSTDNGNRWKTINSGISGTTVRTFCLMGARIFAGTDCSGIFYSTDNGESWTKADSGIYPREEIISLASVTDQSGGTNIFAGTAHGIYRSTNNGVSWDSINSGLPSNASEFYVALSNDGKKLFAGTVAYFPGDQNSARAHIYLSTDKGENWIRRDSGLSGWSFGVNPIIIRDSVIISGTSDGVFVSSNDGVSWSQGNFNYFVTSLAAVGQNIIATSFTDMAIGLFISTNNGMDWNKIRYAISGDTSLPQSGVYAVGNNLYMGGYDIWGHSGILVSTDYGKNWSTITSNLTDTWINLFSISPDGKYVFTGTQGRGAWRHTIGELAEVNAPRQPFSPAGFSLEQNFPNPFNPSTTIKYSIQKECKVTLTVYNTLGEIISVLVDETLNAGIYNVTFNTDGLSSGVYFYRIKAGSFVQAKKMVLLH